MRYHFTGQNSQQKPSVHVKTARDDMEGKEPFCTVGWNVNRYNHYKNNIYRVLTLKIDLPPCDSTVHSWACFREKPYFRKIPRTPVFTASTLYISQDVGLA